MKFLRGLNENRRLTEFDILKIICMVLVIITHVNLPESFDTRAYLFTVNACVPMLMITTGFMFSRSLFKMQDLKKWYNIKVLANRMLRFIIPFLTLLFIIFIVDFASGLRYSFIDFITVRKGPGGYYLPVILQVIVIFPLIYLAVSKFKLGILAMFAIEIAITLILHYTGVPHNTSRMIMHSYIGQLSLGVAIFNYSKFGTISQVGKEKIIDEIKQAKRDKIYLALVIILGALGLVEGMLFTFTSFQDPTRFLLRNGYYLAFALLIIFLTQKAHKVPILNRLCGFLGKITWFIYVAQMLFFKYYVDTMLPICSRIIVSVISSFAMGIIWYYLDFFARKIIGKTYNFFKEKFNKKIN